MKHLLHLILFLAIGLSACSQPLEPIDPNYYGAPVKIPVFLAGNFAELRSNHFHAGIDIKTQGRTGISVYSAADGFISRISISPSGYGNALYIDHPNGTTTVYGHLSSFSSPVEDYIRKIQYEKEEFTINQFVPEGMFPVKKGEQIAKSGNSGSSGGPHLHFEIRRTKEEIILNPLLFHMPVKDKTKPTIQALMVYPVSDDASVSGSHTSKRFETLQAGSAWKLKTAQTIPVYGKIGFGLQTIDFFDGVPNKCGIYSLKLTVDDQLIYSFTMDDLVMEESKYINSHTDYAQAIRTGKRVYRTWVEPGNKLSIYDTLEQRGIFTATDGQIHQVNYEVSLVNLPVGRRKNASLFKRVVYAQFVAGFHPGSVHSFPGADGLCIVCVRINVFRLFHNQIIHGKRINQLIINCQFQRVYSAFVRHSVKKINGLQSKSNFPVNGYGLSCFQLPG